MFLFWYTDRLLYNYDNWWKDPIFQEGKAKEEYDWVTENFNEFLKEYGYIREENIYRVKKASNDKFVFFCHFAVGCVLLSYLFRISPVILWHHLVAAPSFAARFAEVYGDTEKKILE